jgi:Protein of unknown function, DUF481
MVDESTAMRGLLGFAKTSGTTDNTTANGSFHIAHTWEDWKFLAGVGGQYGSTRGETTS